MAPHRALENIDVVSYILQYFGPDSDSGLSVFDDVDVFPRLGAGKQWRILSYCARTSKAFCGPATRLLWRELPLLVPLLSLGMRLSKSKGKFSYDMINESDNGTIIWYSTGGPAKKGLQRFSRFAALVRCIDIPEKEHIDPTVLFHLSLANPQGEPLLPMVEELWCRTSPFLDMIVMFLAGRSLRALTILAPGGWLLNYAAESDTRNAGAVRRLLGALPSKTPELRSLYVCDTSEVDLLDNDMSWVGGLRELRSLRLDCGWDGPFLVHLMPALATLDHLCDLALLLDDRLVAFETPRGFPQLRNLRLDGQSHDDFDGMDALAQIMSPIHLDRLEIVLAFVNTFTENHSLLDAFAGVYAHTLTSIHLSLSARMPRDSEFFPAPPVPFPAFYLLRPLLQLQGLQVIDIRYHRQMSLTDIDVRKLEEVWPSLRSLSLSWRVPNTAGSAPSFHCIVDFILSHPDLSVVHIPAVDIEGRSTRCGDVKAVPSGLAAGDDLDQRIPDPKKVAEVLRVMFPNISVDEFAAEVGSGKWGVVLSTLRDSNPTK
ncbi:uncharacterized protein C8Q71DRAFT_903504 [Rhodofomes roseus]|uniref:F-box domain-containing protein n=1 Tax=Rhodofomes roseus TaxID=34475 RepID=A0ABQ8KTS5_9APHY|nr:uncharacterized protein C8Q71DRAFT_903504 [Rhodofomes roseus]KAH9842404.1 hypothetical protein C8Q71DRAFT_903504 [Rhodofomes roseus]